MSPTPAAAPVEPTRILGIDPGLNTTGYAVIEVGERSPIVREAGVVTSGPRRDTSQLAERLLVLYNGIVEVVEQWRPRAAAVEQLFAHYEHPRTAVLMAHVRGAYLLACAQHSIAVTSYNATQIKKTITGFGRATKEQMQLTMMRELQLAQMPEPHDVADALAAALCHYHMDFGPGRRARLPDAG